MINNEKLVEHFNYVIDKSENLSEIEIVKYIELLSIKLNIKYKNIMDIFIKTLEDKIN